MRKRSRYRPRELRDPLSLLQPVAQRARDEIELRKLGALDAFVRGAAGRSDWLALAECLNATEMAVAMRYLPEPCRAVCQAAEDALQAIAERAIAGRGWGVSGLELQSLRDLMALYAQSLELLPAAQALGAHAAARHWAKQATKSGSNHA